MDVDTNERHWWRIDQNWWILLLVVVESCMCIVILIGNGLVIAAYTKVKKFQNHVLTHFFLIHLAISDFIVGLALAVKVLSHFLYDHWTSPYNCILQFAIVGTPLATSSLLLLLITGERYYSIMNPYHNPESISKLLKYGLILTAWLISLVVMMVIPFVWKKSSNQSLIECELVNGVTEEYWKYLVLPLTYVLLLAVSAMYMKILMVAKDQMDKIQVLAIQVPLADKNHMRNIRLVKTGFMLLGLFLICWLPFTIVLTATLAGNFSHETTVLVFRFCTATLATLSSALNPFIYAARIRRFRVEIKRMLRLPIKFSDKCETYEIKRTFKIKKLSIMNYQTNLSAIDETVKCDNGRLMNGAYTVSNDSIELTTSTESTSTAVTESTLVSADIEHVAETTNNNGRKPKPPISRYERVDKNFNDIKPTKHTPRKQYSSMYPKSSLHMTKSSPLNSSSKWVSKTKVKRASTTYKKKTSKPEFSQRIVDQSLVETDEENDYIAVTVTRVVQDMSDSEEEGNGHIEVTQHKHSGQIRSGQVNIGADCQETASQNDESVPEKTTQLFHPSVRENCNISRKKLKSYHRRPNKPSRKYQESVKIATDILHQPSTLSHSSKAANDSSKLEEILRNQGVAQAITDNNKYLNLQLESDQINLEVKTRKQEMTRAGLRRHSHNRRMFSSTKKHKIMREVDVNRAKSFSGTQSMKSTGYKSSVEVD